MDYKKRINEVELRLFTLEKNYSRKENEPTKRIHRFSL